MPLQVSTASPTSVADSLTHTSTPTFVVIYASVTDGRSWCGDCRAAEPFINAKFGQSEDVVRIIYAGQRDEWRKQGNPWRQEPFSVTNLPTVIKVTGDKWERLVEGDVYNRAKLNAFVGGDVLDMRGGSEK